MAEFKTGKLFGELAMMNPDKATRALSAMTKTDCILMELNREVFNIMVKE
jgi:CRP-like cAMP-binding protein